MLLSRPSDKLDIAWLSNGDLPRDLEKGEWDALLSASAEWFRPILQVAFNTGMRRSEILALRWDDVNFENRDIAVRVNRLSAKFGAK